MHSTIETGMRLLQSNIKLTGRIAEMTAASVYVVMQRSQLFAFGSNSSRKRQEYARMVLEKLQGGGESVVASWQSALENYPLMVGAIASNLTPLADTTTSLSDRAKKPPRLSDTPGAACAFLALYLSTPMHIGIFISTVGLRSIAPVHKRVAENRERLSHQ